YSHTLKKPRKKRVKFLSGIFHLHGLFELVGFTGSSKASIAVEPRRLPGLMVPGTSKTHRRFLSLEQGIGGAENQEEELLCVPKNHYCCGSTNGWLVHIDDKYDMHLCNPFSGVQFQLPSATTLLPPHKAYRAFSKYYVKKAIVSSDPTTLGSETLVLVIYLGECPRLAFCKLGDKAWTPIESPVRTRSHWDALFHKGQFYALYHPGAVAICDIGRFHVRLIEYASPRTSQIYHIQEYLVESAGELYLISRTCWDFPWPTPKEYIERVDGSAVKFEVFKLEKPKNEWVEVKNIGDNAFFVGYNTSFSLAVSSNTSGCKRNCIYFTNDNQPYPDLPYRGCDVGVFYLETQKFEILYRQDSSMSRPTPVWVNPSPFKYHLSRPSLVSDWLRSFLSYSRTTHNFLRLTAVGRQQILGLMVPGKIKTHRRLLSLEQWREGAKIKKPVLLHVPHRHYCCGTTQGWLVFTDNSNDMHLYNSFSGVKLQLPSAKTLPPPQENYRDFSKYYVQKATVSHDLTTSGSEALVLVIYQGAPPRLAFCRLGDRTDVKLIELASPPPSEFYMNDRYLVESAGELYHVSGNRVDFPYPTKKRNLRNANGTEIKFEVFKLLNHNNKWVRVASIGDQAFFVGYNTSFSLKVYWDIPGCKRNCIYFTNASIPYPEGGIHGCDVGVFHLETQKFEILYRKECTLPVPPPMWVTPPPL
ncbi:hypothetical protein GIB67_027957, partial [Kingdonia uniflora]